MSKNILLLAGGAFYGAVQAPCAISLARDIKYDLVMGNSVGAINGSIIAQKDYEVLLDLWNSIDDARSWNGVAGFLDLAIQGRRGYYSLAPVKKLIKKHVSLAKIKAAGTVYGCCSTVSETHEFVTFLSDDIKKDARLHNAIIASASIAAAMEPQPMTIDGKKRLMRDGGHRHNIPLIPDRFAPQAGDNIDVVMCSPMNLDYKPTCKVNRIGEAAIWLVEMLTSLHQASDLDRLRLHVEDGVRVRVFAPPEAIGGMLDASGESIQARLAQGREMLKNPVLLEPPKVG